MKVIKKEFYLVFTAIVISLSSVTAQSEQKESIVGKPCPDYLLNNVKHLYGDESYKVHSIDLKALRGKWVVLDFWTRSCEKCVSSFSTLNQWQKEFSGEAQFVLVGINDMYNWQTESYYEGARVALKLQLPVAYDSMLWRKFNFNTVPHAVIINPNGIVVDVRPVKELNTEVLASLFKERE